MWRAYRRGGKGEEKGGRVGGGNIVLRFPQGIGRSASAIELEAPPWL